MGKDAFLKLLVTQLENQDPLNPMDNTDFVAQLAQFSSLEGLQNINSTMTWMANSVTSLQDFGSASLIGRVVKAETSKFDFDGTNEQVVGFSLGGSAESVSLTITDASGLPVRTIELGARGAGDNEAAWDGKDGRGLALPAGKYGFSVNAKGADGAPMGAEKYILGYVTGVGMEEGSSSIYVNGTAVKRDGIKEIY